MPVPANALSFTLREPVGVAGQIIPWNFPLLMAAWKLAPAIAAGCTCVLKPAEQTPLTALEFANWSGGSGAAAGRGQHYQWRRRSDGSGAGGASGRGQDCVHGKRGGGKDYREERGGHAEARDAGTWAANRRTCFLPMRIGKRRWMARCSACSSIRAKCAPRAAGSWWKRKSIRKFVEAMTEKAKRIKLGPPLERETKMGPLVSKEQYDRVTSYLELGKKEAKTAIGGGRPKAFGKGYYVEPTIFYDVDNSARISREEIFGPVASVIPFENEARCDQDCERHTVWIGRGRVDARYLQGISRGEVHARGNYLGESHAADVCGSAVGRLQAVRIWTRAWAVGVGGISGDEAGIRESG